MKKVFLGAIPILAVLLLVMNFLGEGTVRVQAVNDLRAQADTFPSNENLNWARTGSMITMTVFDNDPSGFLRDCITDAAVAGANNPAVVDCLRVALESDQEEDDFNLTVIEVNCNNFPCAATRPMLSGAIRVVDNAANSGVLAANDVMSDGNPLNETLTGGTNDDSDFFMGTFFVEETGTRVNATDPTATPRPILFVENEDVVDANYRFGTAQFDIEIEDPDVDSLEPDDEDVFDDKVVDVTFEITDGDSQFIAPDDLNSALIQQENFAAILLSSIQCGEEDGDIPGGQGLFDILNTNVTPAAFFINHILDVTLGPDLNKNGLRNDTVIIDESIHQLDLNGDGTLGEVQGSINEATIGLDLNNDGDQIDVLNAVDETVANAGAGFDLDGDGVATNNNVTDFDESIVNAGAALDLDGDGSVWARVPVQEKGIRNLDCDGSGAAFPAGDIDIIYPDVDDDYDEIDEGYEVAREVNTGADEKFFLGIVIVDNAGNFDFHNVDTGEADRVFNEVEVDEDEATIRTGGIRTGVAFNSTDNEYEDDERDWLQVMFDDQTDLEGSTVDADDFVVEGHDVRRAVWYDLDPEEILGGPDSSTPGTPTDFDGTPFRCYNDITKAALANCIPNVGGNPAAGDIVIPHPRESAEFAGIPSVNAFAHLRRAVFLQLEDELDADEEDFDVNIVPDGIDDEAGNTTDSEEGEATDYIPPRFSVLEMTSPRPPDSDGNLISGEDDEIELIITSDEDLDDDPDVTVFFIRCEEFNGGPCPITGGNTIDADVDEIGRNRWRVVIDEPEDTGYYSILIEGIDDSRQDNEGTLGIEEADLGDLTGDGFFNSDGDVNDDDAIFFEGDILLPNPFVRAGGENAETDPDVEFRNPFFIEIDFTEAFDPGSGNPEDRLTEDDEYEDDNFSTVEILLFELDGVDLTDQVSTTDDETFLVAIENIAIGDHEIVINAIDAAGNELEDELDLDFTVEERDPFGLEMRPGWNLFSVPGDPFDGNINTVFGPGVPVTTIYTFDPSVPGGWLVAVRDNPEDEWVGDLTTITDENGYWGLATQIVKVDIDIPRLSGGSVNGGTPIQPPSLDLFPGWNLIPLVDVTGEAQFEDFIDADVYFSSAANAQGGVSITRILTFDTITNEWEVVQFFPNPISSDGLDLNEFTDPPDPFGLPAELDDPDLFFGDALWVFALEEFTLVPGGNPVDVDPDDD